MSIETEVQIFDDIDPQRDVIMAYLEREREPWLIAKAKAERADGQDATLNLERGRLIGILDVMLEELHELDHPEAYGGAV